MRPTDILISTPTYPMIQSLPQRLRVAAAAITDAPVSLAQLAQAHGSAAQGTLLVLLATPCVLPVPGVGNIMGLALMLMGLAMWRGQDAGVLPERVAGVELSAAWARRVLGLMARVYELAGRWSRERLTHLTAPGAGSWLAAKIALMGAVIFLPIPFGNVLPALALVLLGLGLAFRDGLVVLGSTVVAGLALGYTTGLGVAVWAWGLAPVLAWFRPA